MPPPCTGAVTDCPLSCADVPASLTKRLSGEREAPCPAQRGAAGPLQLAQPPRSLQTRSGAGLRPGTGRAGPVTFPSFARSLRSSILLFSTCTSSLVPLSTTTSSSWKAAPHWREQNKERSCHRAPGGRPHTPRPSPTTAPRAPGKPPLGLASFRARCLSWIFTVVLSPKATASGQSQPLF